MTSFLPSFLGRIEALVGSGEDLKKFPIDAQIEGVSRISSRRMEIAYLIILIFALTEERRLINK